MQHFASAQLSSHQILQKEESIKPGKMFGVNNCYMWNIKIRGGGGGGGVGGCGVVVACVKGACVKEEKEIWCVLPI